MPECLGTMKEFRKKYAIPISKARDLDATDKEVRDHPPAAQRTCEPGRTRRQHP